MKDMDVATELSKALGSEPEFWLNLSKNYHDKKGDKMSNELMKEKLWEIEQLQTRIAELEADNANLNDWLNAWKESFSLAQVEIAKLKADNRSLVEQMNAMALEMGGRKMLTLTSCYKNYIKLCSDFGFALGSIKATLFYLLLLETYSGDDDTAKLRKDIMETTDKLRLAVTETQIFVENLLINIMRN